MEIFFYSLWDYLFFFYFLLYCAPLVTGAFFLAKKVCSENPFERFAFTMLLTLVTGGVNFGLCGLFKIISVQSIFIANLLIVVIFSTYITPSLCLSSQYFLCSIAYCFALVKVAYLKRINIMYVNLHSYK